MITNVRDVQEIYRSRDYKAIDIVCPQDNFFQFRIEFNGQELVSDCQRRYEIDTVYHMMLRINDNLIRKGHGRKIHNKECKAYKNHGIKTIKLFATSDGICVWPKFGFTIDHSNEDNIGIEHQILSKYREYLGNIHFPDDPTKVKSLMKNCKTIKSIVSKDFKQYTLPEIPNKPFFTDYLSNSWNGYLCIAMSKEV